jgi:hypothetical protein
MPNWRPPSAGSDVLLESQLEQIRALGRIEAKVEPIPDMRNRIEGNTVRIARLETKLDDHIQSCQPAQPRRKFISMESLKENWTVFLLAFQLGVFLLLQMLGQPDKAQQVWATSPAFQRGERGADSP